MGGGLIMSEHLDNNHPKPEDLRVEYQKAQDSAEHHDHLVWIITSILWASTLILLGLVVTAIGMRNGLKWPITIVAALAILLTLYLWICAQQLRNVKVQKYKRAIEIEKQLGLEQHSKLSYSAGSQTIGYSLIMHLFFAVWFFLIAFVWISPN